MSNTFNPLVSIVIPVYNGSNYLREAIDSALAQIYRNIEVLVINDGSRDDGKTEAVALSYGDRIRYFAKENGGVATALNKGIAEMRGEYFSWLSHDDVYYPSKIEVQVNYLEKFENKLTVLYSDQDYINNDGVIIGEHVCPQIETRSFKLDFIRGWILHFCTTLVPRECFRQSGVFNIELITSQDLEMIYRLSLKYNFVHIPKKLVKVRLHDMMGQVSLKETVIAENDKLRLSFLKAVSFHEIQKYSSEPPGGYFLRFAEIMKEANYKHATKYAAKLAIKGLINNYKNDNKAMLFKALTILYPDLMGKYKKVRIKIKFVKSIL